MITINHEDIDQLLEFILNAIESPEAIDFDVFNEHVNSFNALNQRVNQSLANIARLLDKGLRDEAMQEAGEEGALLEIYERLDFPEREAFCELIEEFGFAKPAPLNHDAAARLNSAFGTVKDLSGLLKQHRILALARGPLIERIRVLNSLSIADADNPMWEQDSLLFQKARLVQIPSEMELAIKTEDHQTIQRLDNDFRSVRWSIDVPQKLTTQLSTLQAAHVQSTGITEIRKLSETLKQAYSEMDIPSVYASADAIAEIASRLNLLDDSPEMLEIASELEWVNERRDDEATQKRNQEALGEFEQLLDSTDDRNQLERAFSRIKLLGDELPDELRRRAIERLESLDIIARRKTAVRIALGGMGLLLVLSASGLWIYLNQLESAAVDIEKQTENLVQSSSWTQADEFIEKQTVAIRSRPKMVELAVQVDQSVKQENDRQATFNDVLARMKSAHEDEKSSADPQEASLRRLQALAQLPEELDEWKLQEKRTQEKILTRNRKTNEEKLAELQLLESETRRSINGISTKETPAKLRSMSWKLERFQDSLTSVSLHLKSQAGGLITECASALEGIEQESKRATLVRAITDSVGNLADYQIAIRNLLQAFPDDPLCQDLKTAKDRGAEIQSAILASELFKGAAYRSTADTDIKGAVDWLDMFKQLQSRDPSHFLLSSLTVKADHLKRLTKIAEALSQLNEIGRSSLLGDLYVYRIGPKRYLSAMPPTDRMKVLEYYADTSLLVEEQKLLFRIEPGKISGNSIFGKEFRKAVKGFNEKNFTPATYKLLKSILDSPEELDPVFRLLLYRKVLETTLPVSLPLEVGFKDSLEQFGEDALNWKANWIGPEPDKLIDRQRTSAGNLLSQELEKWKSNSERMSKTYKEIAATPEQPFEWVGWISQDNYRWIANTKRADPDELLFTIRHYPGSSDRIVISTDATENSSESRIITNREPFRTGMPIYAMPAPKGKP